MKQCNICGGIITFISSRTTRGKDNRFYDENGKFHLHRTIINRREFNCHKCGTIVIESGSKCWCGWTAIDER